MTIQENNIQVPIHVYVLAIVHNVSSEQKRGFHFIVDPHKAVYTGKLRNASEKVEYIWKV
jgi:hypothetical protein